MITSEQVRKAHIRTALAWDDLCDMIQHPFHPHRKKIYNEYIEATREQCRIDEEYSRVTGLVPDYHLPFEYYYLYYKRGTMERKRWEKICEHYKLTGKIDLSIGRYEVYG